MTIQEQQQGAVTVLRPEGPLVEAELKQFREHVARTMASSMGRFVIDMSAVPYVDSGALDALLDVSEELGHGGQALRLCSANKTVREVLELTEITSFFDHFDDANTAVRSFL